MNLTMKDVFNSLGLNAADGKKIRHVMAVHFEAKVESSHEPGLSTFRSFVLYFLLTSLPFL
jgi:hypothetical protein